MKTKINFIILLSLIYSTSFSQVNYVDINPDTVLNSVRKWVFVDGCSECTYPIPQDSIAYYYLDVNNDNKNDFRIIVHHFSDYVGNNAININISSLSIDTFYIANDSYYAILSILNKQNDTISSKNEWFNNGAIVLGDFMLPSQFFSGDRYIGIKYKQDTNDYYGWIHIFTESPYSITIKDFAISTIPNYSILAGDTIVFKDPNIINSISKLDILSSKINITPNPTNGLFYIDINYESNEKIKIEIFDMIGNQLNAKYSVENNKIKFDISNFQNGIYFVKLTSGNKSNVNKIIKE